MAARLDPAEKLERLLQDKKALEARIAAETSKLRKQERKDRDRESIIIGAALRAHAEIDPAFKTVYDKALNAAVSRDFDRAFLIKRGVLPKRDDPIRSDFPDAAE